MNPLLKPIWDYFTPQTQGTFLNSPVPDNQTMVKFPAPGLTSGSLFPSNPNPNPNATPSLISQQAQTPFSTPAPTVLAAHTQAPNVRMNIPQQLSKIDPQVQQQQASSTKDTQIPQTLAQIPNDPGAQYNDPIASASAQYNVPAPLLKAMLAHESMQFTPKYITGYHTDGTGRGIAGIDSVQRKDVTDQQAFDPNFAIGWAAKTLAGYYQQEGNWINALRRYNGGGNYDSPKPGYAGVPVKQRTMNYANNVLQQAKHYGSN